MVLKLYRSLFFYGTVQNVTYAERTVSSVRRNKSDIYTLVFAKKNYKGLYTEICKCCHRNCNSQVLMRK